MKLLVCALLLFSATSVSFGSEPATHLTAADASCACNPKASDPFEEPVKFAFGKFTGQCVDSCRFRRARVRSNAGGELVVTNLLHLGKYVQARISLADVTGVEAGFERFAPGVDHMLLRFSFDRGVPLFAQDGSNTPAGTTRLVVLSSEGVPPKGRPYSLSEGYGGQYLLDHRLVSGEELAAWTKKLVHPLRFLPLVLSAEQSARILERGILRSDAVSFRQAYQLFSNNCSTSAIALLDEETGYHASNPWEDGWEQGLPVVGPFNVERALRNRGLLRDGSAPTAVATARSSSASFAPQGKRTRR
jgi:hypothetical protein